MERKKISIGSLAELLRGGIFYIFLIFLCSLFVILGLLTGIVNFLLGLGKKPIRKVKGVDKLTDRT